MDNVCCVILAAGAGKRMKSDKPKVLSNVLFKPMIQWVIDAVKSVGINDICIVSGYKRDMLKSYLDKNNITCTEAIQEEQKGTAHAVMSATNFLNKHKNSDVIVLNGDAPFIDTETIIQSLYKHRKYSVSATVITAKIDNPYGYGRIIRDENTSFFKSIIEHKDADESQLKINEVNSGDYWFKTSDLLDVLGKVKNQNAQGEYYLTDTLEILLNDNHDVKAFLTDNSDVILGANDMMQLSSLNEIARNKIIDTLLINGVSIPCRDGIMISPDAKISEKCTVLPSTIIKGCTEIKKGCTLGPNSVIINCKLGSNISLVNVYCSNYTFEDNEAVNPFSKLGV